MTIRGSIFLFLLLLLIVTPPFLFQNKSKTQKFTELLNPVAEAVPQEIKVLGITKPTPQKTITPTLVPFVNCTGPDGKTAYAPQKDCDNVNSFWAAHPPPVNSNNNNTSIHTDSPQHTSPQPAPIVPTITPTLITPTPTVAPLQPDDDKDNDGKKKKKKKKDRD